MRVDAAAAHEAEGAGLIVVGDLDFDYLEQRIADTFRTFMKMNATPGYAGGPRRTVTRLPRM